MILIEKKEELLCQAREASPAIERKPSKTYSLVLAVGSRDGGIMSEGFASEDRRRA